MDNLERDIYICDSIKNGRTMTSLAEELDLSVIRIAQIRDKMKRIESNSLYGTANTGMLNAVLRGAFRKGYSKIRFLDDATREDIIDIYNHFGPDEIIKWRCIGPKALEDLKAFVNEYAF